MNARYRREKEEFRFKESCEDCNHYCPERDKCAVLYPVTPHLRKTIEEAQDGERIYFCKMFEAR